MIKSIFIIDDAEWHNVVLENLLKAQGYGVKAFTSGLELLDSLKREQPNLLISDIDMPEINGFELCRRIQRLPQVDYLPIMFVSSKDEAEVRGKVQKNGAVGFLQKPFQKQLLLNVVAQKV